MKLASGGGDWSRAACAAFFAACFRSFCFCSLASLLARSNSSSCCLCFIIMSSWRFSFYKGLCASNRIWPDSNHFHLQLLPWLSSWLALLHIRLSSSLVARESFFPIFWLQVSDIRKLIETKFGCNRTFHLLLVLCVALPPAVASDHGFVASTRLHRSCVHRGDGHFALVSVLVDHLV